MTKSDSFDESLARRLPLPLAQLYRRAHNANSAVELHHAALYLWEASLKLLGSAAIVDFAMLGRPEPELAERLQCLVLPSTGHWWEFVRRLVPVLGDAKVGEFNSVRETILGSSRNDWPNVERLNIVLCEVLGKHPEQTTSITTLFDRLVQYRNREIGHGTGVLRPSRFYHETGEALLSGMSELLSHLDVLAGGRLLCVTQVVRQPSGDWHVGRCDLTGESVKKLDPLSLPSSAAADLPRPECVYFDRSSSADGDAADANSCLAHWRLLHPLVLYDRDASEVFFLNSRKSKHRAEYLCYRNGEVINREGFGQDVQQLLERVLHRPVTLDELDESNPKTPVVVPVAEAPPAPPVPPALPTSDAPSPVGKKLGEFELLSRIGRGNMGVVYRAWQPSLGRQVALKSLLRPGDASSEARFRREIRALGHVDHPNVVKAYTSGWEGEQWFYAMELIEGTDLASVCKHLADSAASEIGEDRWRHAVTTACDLARTSEETLSNFRPIEHHVASEESDPAVADSTPGPTAASPAGDRTYVRSVVDLIRQAAAGAHALHENGVVHRDIKPGNIMLTADGSRAVLADLGLAQIRGIESITKTIGFVGTLRYASPEQVLAAKNVDRRSDVYSLGATLWELLTLRPLFGATEQTNQVELMRSIQRKLPEPIRKYNANVPRDLQAVVLKCLEKEPEHRYPTAAALAADLENWLDHRPVSFKHGGLYKARKFTRRNRRTISLAAAGLAAIALLLSGYYYYAVQERTEFFADVTERWNEPFGVHPLSESESRGREFSVRLVRRGAGGPVVRSEVIDGAGNLHARKGLIPLGQEFGFFDIVAPERMRACRVVYDRDEHGEIIRECAFDRNNAPLWVFARKEPNLWQFETVRRTSLLTTPSRAPQRESKKESPAASNGDQNIGPRGHLRTGTVGDRPRTESGSVEMVEPPAIIPGEMVTFDLDDNGFRKTVRFFDERGKSLWRPECGYGFNLVNNSDGCTTEYHFIHDDRADDSNGVFIVKLDVEAGMLKKARFFDDSGSTPVLYKNSYSGFTCDYDEGRCTRRTFLDLQGKPLSKEGTVCGWRQAFDKSGRVVTYEFVGPDLQDLVLDSNQIAGWRQDYDNDGNPKQLQYFGTDRQPTRHKDGVLGWIATYKKGRMLQQTFYGYERGAPRMTVTYNGLGYAVKHAYFDDDGKPTLEDGFAGCDSELDDDGNVLKRTFFGVDGQPTRHKDGFLGWTASYENGRMTAKTLYGYSRGAPTMRVTYNSKGYAAKRDYLDESGQPVLEDGIAGCVSEFDNDGNEKKQTFFGIDGKPARHSNGNLGWTAVYGNGRIAEKTYFGYSQGASRMRVTYDDRGHAVRTAYLSDEDKPDLEYGVAGFASEFDAAGNELSRTYFGIDGGPTRHNDGNLGWKAVYENGRMSEKTLFGYDRGAPTMTVTYNERGYAVQYAYFDDDGKPVLEDAVAGCKSTFDDKGNELERVYFGVDGQPTHHKDGNLGWRALYNNGRMIEKTFYGYEQGATRIRVNYNDKGYAVQTAYLNDEDKAVLEYGVAGFNSEFNDAGKELRRTFYGVDGRPTRHTDGNLGWTAAYENGRMTEKTFFGYDRGAPTMTVTYNEPGYAVKYAYFDDNGKPVLEDGVAGCTSTFDDKGNELTRVYFGVDGKPTHHKDGNLGWRAVYNNGRMTEKTFYGYEQGATRIRVTYNDKGYAVQTAYFDDAGKPALEYGVAGWKSDFDDQGRELKRSFFGVDGKPARHTDGFLGWTAVYDNGRVTEKTFYGYAQGASRMKVTYSDKGYAVRTAYVDDLGQPVLEYGVAGYQSTFDSQGNESKRAFFGADGKPAHYNDGNLGWTAAYENGRIMEKTFYGYERGAPRLIVTYDDKGYAERHAYFDDRGMPVLEYGIAGYESKYDDDGNELKRAFFGADDRPARYSEGNLGWTAVYENGRMTEKTLYGYDQGAPRRRIVYDGQGREIVHDLLDNNGQPYVVNGIAKRQLEYDAAGTVTHVSAFDDHGKPVVAEVVIGSVLPGTQAESSGIRAGDIVLDYNGVRGLVLALQGEVSRVAALDPAPEKVPLRIRRGGQVQTIQLAPGAIGIYWDDRAILAPAASATSSVQQKAVDSGRSR